MRRVVYPLTKEEKIITIVQDAVSVAFTPRLPTKSAKLGSDFWIVHSLRSSSSLNDPVSRLSNWGRTEISLLTSGTQTCYGLSGDYLGDRRTSRSIRPRTTINVLKALSQWLAIVGPFVLRDASQAGQPGVRQPAERNT